MRQRRQTPRQRPSPHHRRWAYRRQQVLRALVRALFMLLLACAGIAAVTVFFRIDTIEITGTTHYTSGQLRAEMSVKQGDNLYLFNKIQVQNELLEKFPYLNEVQIRRSLPDGLQVTVTECAPALAVPSDGGYYLLSENGKLLEQTDAANGLPVITGVSLLGMELGQTIDRTADAYVDGLAAVLDALRESEMLAQVDFINLQSLTDVRIGYQDRFDVRVGTVDELTYRLRFAKVVIDERLSPSDVGRLYWDTRGRLHYVPGTLDEVRQSQTGGSTAQAVDLSKAAEPTGLTEETDETAADDAPSTDDSAADEPADTADEDAAAAERR